MIHKTLATAVLFGAWVGAVPALAEGDRIVEAPKAAVQQALAQRLLRLEECFPSQDPHWMEAVLREEMQRGLRHCADIDLELARRAAQKDLRVLHAFEDEITDLRKK